MLDYNCDNSEYVGLVYRLIGDPRLSWSPVMKFIDKILPVALIFLMLGVAPRAQFVRAASSATQIVLSYSLPAGTIAANQIFSVPVNLSVPADKLITSGQFDLSWNPAVLDLLSFSDGNYFATATCPIGVTPQFFAPTIDHIAGTLTAYGSSALGIPPGQGCTGSGTFVTLNFKALATGRSTSLVSGVILTDNNINNYLPGDYVFPNFTLFVGEKLAVTSFSLQPNWALKGGFIARVIIANQGAAASLADSFHLATDGNATPASQNGNIPVIAAGGSAQVTVSGFGLLTAASSSQVTLTFGDQTLIATFARAYPIFLPTIRR